MSEIVPSPAPGGVGAEPIALVKSFTFTGAATTGAVGTQTVFTVTGEVEVVELIPICDTDLTSAGGGSISLGVTGNTVLFIAATVATAIDAAEFWFTTTPTANALAIPAALKNIAITDDIISTVTVGDVTAGVIRYMLLYRPISAGALVV